MSPKDRCGEDLDDEPLEGELPPDDEEPCDCESGWLDYLDADHPVPCPRCKPHLAGPRVHLH